MLCYVMNGFIAKMDSRNKCRIFYHDGYLFSFFCLTLFCNFIILYFKVCKYTIQRRFYRNNILISNKNMYYFFYFTKSLLVGNVPNNNPLMFLLWFVLFWEVLPVKWNKKKHTLRYTQLSCPYPHCKLVQMTFILKNSSCT